MGWERRWRQGNILCSLFFSISVNIDTSPFFVQSQRANVERHAHLTCTSHLTRPPACIQRQKHTYHIHEYTHICPNTMDPHSKVAHFTFSFSHSSSSHISKIVLSQKNGKKNVDHLHAGCMQLWAHSKKWTDVYVDRTESPSQRISFPSQHIIFCLCGRKLKKREQKDVFRVTPERW